MQGKRLSTFILAAALSACQLMPGKEKPAEPEPVTRSGSAKPGSAEKARQSDRQARQMLDRGVRKYEDGQYQAASNLLQASLKAGLDSRKDQTRAYKYLAFIECISNREKACRSYFHKALSIDAGFRLTPIEAGHPTWGPVFKSVQKSMTR